MLGVLAVLVVARDDGVRGFFGLIRPVRMSVIAVRQLTVDRAHFVLDERVVHARVGLAEDEQSQEEDPQDPRPSARCGVCSEQSAHPVVEPRCIQVVKLGKRLFAT